MLHFLPPWYINHIYGPSGAVLRTSMYSMFKTIVNWPKSVFSFFREAREELKKVTWPNRETTIRYTIIVVIASIVVGTLTGGVDYVFSLIIENFII